MIDEISAILMGLLVLADDPEPLELVVVVDVLDEEPQAAKASPNTKAETMAADLFTREDFIRLPPRVMRSLNHEARHNVIGAHPTVKRDLWCGRRDAGRSSRSSERSVGARRFKEKSLPRLQAAASSSSSFLFASAPPRYHSRTPSFRMTRWHAMTTGSGLLAQAHRTARAALGLWTAEATSG